MIDFPANVSHRERPIPVSLSSVTIDIQANVLDELANLDKKRKTSGHNEGDNKRTQHIHQQLPNLLLHTYNNMSPLWSYENQEKPLGVVLKEIELSEYTGVSERLVARLCDYMASEVSDEQRQQLAKTITELFGRKSTELSFSDPESAKDFLVDTITRREKYKDQPNKLETFLEELKRLMGNNYPLSDCDIHNKKPDTSSVELNVSLELGFHIPVKLSNGYTREAFSALHQSIMQFLVTQGLKIKLADSTNAWDLVDEELSFTEYQRHSTEHPGQPFDGFVQVHLDPNQNVSDLGPQGKKLLDALVALSNAACQARKQCRERN